MIDVSQINIHQLIIHKVGSAARDEGVWVSRDLTDVAGDDELRLALTQYFVKPFKFDWFYRLHHEADLSMNEIYTFASRIFDQPATFQEQSVHILNHLYAQSTHPQIKPGELYVTHFNNVLYGNFSVDAIGIFKSENKDAFLQVKEKSDTDLGVYLQEGINIKKLDKGCIIFNLYADSGYRVCMVDTGSRGFEEAQYWKDDFLQLAMVEDEHYYTDEAITMCSEFYDSVIAPASELPEKKEKLEFINSTMEYFSKHDTFDEQSFVDTVLHERPQHAQHAPMFKAYKETYEEANDLPPFDAMPISHVALKKAKQSIRNNIKTDTGIDIKLKNESFPYLERGYDEERQMYFYKVYFNEEE
ncbi:nucleoid-associated protein [Paenibacillus sp. ACRRX]|uniref:nucleoid-associated protein n=1 Tax=unclassified Paenibacillus TaxID=185978 RepID=UPI001EF45B80|nr:nucleoid-associated protein [Paenibacillus sp. UMB4589-SE434]MCG7409906.1 nucleoid-associated protein [Paenibacillus sp. ACRRX]MDK8183028.1 nucleoid-associated protein [Paenibacillus sp. UMB4589-SE434]